MNRKLRFSLTRAALSTRQKCKFLSIYQFNKHDEKRVREIAMAVFGRWRPGWMGWLLATLVLVSSASGYDWEEAQELYPGVKYIDVWRSWPDPNYPDGQRPARVHVLQIDTTTPGLKFYTTPRTADWVINSREADKQRTRDFISSSRGTGPNDKNLVAAINANFFGSGDPCNVRGLAVSEGVLVSPHATDYSSAFLVNRQGGVSMAETFDNFDISNIQTAISGRPFCVQNGVGQDPYGTGAPRPRTQIGISQDNRYVYLMAIDGDQEASKGVYTIEGGRLLAEFGAWTGINLDGGGSTTMAWWNPTANRAELLNVLGASARSVGNNIGIYYQRPNSPPFLAAIPNRIINGGNELTFVVFASDPDPTDTLTFSLDPGAPAGAWIDPVSGMFSWTPPVTDVDVTNTITVRVTDNGDPPLSATNAFTVIVRKKVPNSPPIVSPIANQIINAGATLMFECSAFDPDPIDNLVFSLDSGAPPDASIHPLTGVFIWRPSEAYANTTNLVTIRATDNGDPPMTDTASFSITVLPRNNPPMLAPISNRSVHAGTMVQFTAFAFDPNPDDTLTFSLDPGTPAGAQMGASDGVFVWTPGDTDVGPPWFITVRVTDDGHPPMSGTASFSVTVEPRPTLLSISISEGTATLHWNAIAGMTYRVEYKDDLDDPIWSAHEPEITATNTLASAHDNEFGVGPRRFYRIVALPAD
jgi:hypothetical protein